MEQPSLAFRKSRCMQHFNAKIGGISNFAVNNDSRVLFSTLWKKRKAISPSVTGLQVFRLRNCKLFRAPQPTECECLTLMVAFNVTRRRAAAPASTANTAPASLIYGQNPEKWADNSPIRGSRRAATTIRIERDARGEIGQVRIGSWRSLAASTQRRIAEVRELNGDRVAVRWTRSAVDQGRSADEIWQIYCKNGRLLASLQISADGGFALFSDYDSHQASQWRRDQGGELVAVERWSI